MPVEIVTVPCLSDNYAYLVHNPENGDTALVDAPEAAPIQMVLADKGWRLTDVLITHHHADHVQGLDPLRSAFNPRVIGCGADAGRLPTLDLAVASGDTITVAGQATHVLDVSGHTINHVAYHMPDCGHVFTADSLMTLGCGRVFEGTFDQMWASLAKFADMPDDTIVCSGHEYTATNARFALTIDPENAALQARAKAVFAATEAGEPTVPSVMGEERATNPFLRAGDPALKAALGLADAPDAEVFAEIRRRKDAF